MNFIFYHGGRRLTASPFFISMAVTFTAVVTLLSGCTRPSYRYEEGMAWNTLYHITYESSVDLSDSIISVFESIDSSLSPFNPLSVVSAINVNTSDSVDGHFKAVYEESRKIHSITGGAFDPTLAPVIRAWGFGQGHSVSRDTIRLDSLLRFVGLDKTGLDGSRLIKRDPRIEFNFSALAKGYGVDCVADMLLRNGVDNFLVEIGGEIRAAGKNPRGEFWHIGIDRPSPDSAPGETMAYITVADGAVATSGNYRNFHETEGRRFGHTVSPSTGRPVDTDILSATVLSASCMEADALATSCMVLGSEEALRLCTALGVGVMLIKYDMRVVENSIWQDAALETAGRD